MQATQGKKHSIGVGTEVGLYAIISTLRAVVGLP